MIGVLTSKFLISSFIIDQLQNQNDQSPLNFLMRSRFDHDQNLGIKFFDARDFFFCKPKMPPRIGQYDNHDVEIFVAQKKS
jgi:hypothetical protein